MRKKNYHEENKLALISLPLAAAKTKLIYCIVMITEIKIPSIKC